MRKAILAALLVGCLGRPDALSAQPTVDFDPEKIQVLIITGHTGFAHRWRETTPLLKQTLEDTSRFEVRVTEEFRGAGPETLAPYDVVIVNYNNLVRVPERAWSPDFLWGERTGRAFAEFVRSGKGVVVYHAALGAFDEWMEFEKISGGTMRINSYHSPPHDFTVDIRDPDHPITRGLKSSLPVENDELYANMRWQPEGAYHVLATAWDDHSLYSGVRSPWTGQTIPRPPD